jgi:hypothetical protein
MRVSESTVTDAWLYTTLTEDGTLAALVGDRVYADLAPGDAAHPLVVFALQSSVDLLAVGAVRVWAEQVYQVQAIGEGSAYAALAAVADQVDTLLHRASGTVTAGTVWSCVREGELRYTETDRGVTYHHLGALWRIMATKGS